MVNRTLLDHYNSERGARSYQADYGSKLHRKISDRLERRLLRGLFVRLGPLGSLLDLPCGAGRLYGLLRGAAAEVVEADWSFPMLRLSRETTSAGARAHIRCNGLQLPFRDKAFEGVVSIRLNHHFDRQEEREQHLAELLRVAGRAVICTWFSHHSLRAWTRRLRARLGGRKREKFTLRGADVRRIAAAAGFRLEAARPLAPFALGSSHIFGLFVRE